MPFRDIVGHGPVVHLVSRAVSRDTLPPSLLLAGPDGVGKRRVAVAIAQVLNCAAVGATSAGGVDACGECGPCGRIERGGHADVVVLEPADNGAIAVDVVRHATSQATYRPFEGRRRVVIVDDADRLVGAAQNALLKTLEEPPPSSCFVLVTSRPDALLATVRSRCQRLGFGQLTIDEVATVLARTQDGTPAEVRAAAASSGGSVGRALRLATGELARAREAAVVFMESVARARDGRGRLESAKAMSPKGRGGASVRQDLRRRLEAMTSLLRDIELVAAGADVQRLANADLVDRMEGLSRVYGGRRAVAAFDAVERAREAVDANVSPKVVSDWLACQL